MIYNQAHWRWRSNQLNERGRGDHLNLLMWSVKNSLSHLHEKEIKVREALEKE